jgi:hypothetical protein
VTTAHGGQLCQKTRRQYYLICNCVSRHPGPWCRDVIHGLTFETANAEKTFNIHSNLCAEFRLSLVTYLCTKDPWRNCLSFLFRPAGRYAADFLGTTYEDQCRYLSLIALDRKQDATRLQELIRSSASPRVLIKPVKHIHQGQVSRDGWALR